MPQEIVLAADETPKKLENFLKKRFPIGYVRKLFRKSGIRLNGKHPKPDDVIRAGDRILFYIPFETGSAPPRLGKAVARIEIIFEDDSLLILDKPAGLAVQEGRTVTKRDSVLGILESRYREKGITPTLVHRLDKDTSGLLLVAKDQETAGQLESLFETRRVEKAYLCLLAGRLPQNEGTIDLPLPGRDGIPVRSVTRFKVEKRFSDTTLARVRIETGRMHQIRLHFARLGYPVVMDDQHGDFAFNKRFRKQYGLKRQFLHASSLVLEYGGKKRTWTAPLPEDLAATLRSLEGKQGGFKKRE
jgi:23S rRNA pseudouridine955/2504/2580 synthase